MRLEKFDFRAVCRKKKKVVKPIAALTFLSLAAFNVYINVKPEGSLPETKREKTKVPSAVVNWGSTNERQFDGEFGGVSEFERIREGMGITNTRGVKKDIVLKSKSLLFVDANAGGFLLGHSGKNKRGIWDIFPANGWVIAKIRVDGNDWVMNTSVANSHIIQENNIFKNSRFIDLSFPLYSSVFYQKVLERGEHKIEAIGLFCGNFDRPDIKLSYSEITVDPIHTIGKVDVWKDKERYLLKRNESVKNSVIPDIKLKSKANLNMELMGGCFEGVDPLIYRARKKDVFDHAVNCADSPVTS